jgi:hypothetical protein
MRLTIKLLFCFYVLLCSYVHLHPSSTTSSLSLINQLPVSTETLQHASSYGICQPNLLRQQVLEMEVQLWAPNLEALCNGYVKQDICQLSQNVKLSKARIYFRPKYTPDEKGRQALYCDLRPAAQEGGDFLTLWGKGRGKDRLMHIRCQCAPLYHGSKMDKDKEEGSVVPRKYYRVSTYTKDRKNQRHGRKEINGSHRTTSDHCISKVEERCPFICPVMDTS